MVSTPDSGSLAASVIWTGVWFHPSAFAGEFAVATVIGAVSSMLIFPTDVVAVFPARSAADPVTDWLAPSPGSTTSGGQKPIPEIASLQSKCTVTSLLFHP